MSRMTLFALQRIEAYLEGYKVGTRAADWSPALCLAEEVVKWLVH